jgi:hypothetical protein
VRGVLGDRLRAHVLALVQDLNARLANREEYQTVLADRRAILKTELPELNDQLVKDKALEEKKEEQYDDITAEILAASAPSSSGASPVVPSGAAPNIVPGRLVHKARRNPILTFAVPSLVFTECASGPVNRTRLGQPGTARA